MLKHLAILAITTFIAFGVPGQPNETSRPEKQVAKQGQPTIHAADGVDKQTCCCADQAKPCSNSPTGNAPIERPHWWTASEWWLVLIAGLTGGVIGWQSLETRKAADAAKMSAETAFRQTVLMEKQNRNATNKERARLYVQHQSNAPMAVDGPVVQDVDGRFIVEVNAYVNVTNHGGTKAFGVKASGCIYAADIDSLDSGTRQWEVPDVMDTDENVTLRGTPFMMREEWEGVGNGAYPLHILGSILYNDIFGDPHETPFHFSWAVQDQSWGKEGHWVTHAATST